MSPFQDPISLYILFFVLSLMIGIVIAVIWEGKRRDVARLDRKSGRVPPGEAAYFEDEED